jgi:hypothetical protein
MKRDKRNYVDCSFFDYTPSLFTWVWREILGILEEDGGQMFSSNSNRSTKDNPNGKGMDRLPLA